ncbi:hypothetical protein Tco_0627648 [Tanacetum coccineum]|uniref:Uncharacterized protein n=1 Tax=Tanacetum coccineum TaxID=301880 RepID=A0ABQ4WNV0_9ASTR
MTAKQIEDIHNFKQEGDESLYQAWERNIRSNSSNDELAALVNKLDNMGRDINKLKKSIHAIQVGCQNCEGPHLDKDCPLNEEVKQVEEVRYGEFVRTMFFDRNNGGRQTLAETVKKYIKEASMRQVKQDVWKTKRYDTIATRLQGYTLSYNTSSLDDRKYSSLALEDESLDHLETRLYDLMIKGEKGKYKLI